MGKKKISNDSYGIEDMVLKCFLRVIKDKKQYMIYRRGVCNSGIMKAIINKRKGWSSIPSDSPFRNASRTEDVVSTLRKITNDMAKSNGKRNGSKDLDRYEHVTMTINHLLHFFMETSGVGMQSLCELGEQIYEMSCNKLFGDTYEDIEKQEEKELNNATQDQLSAILFQNYIRDMQAGKVSTSISFDDYIRENKDKFEKAIKNKKVKMEIPGEAVGHMLGRGPEMGVGGENVIWHGDNAWGADDGYGLDDEPNYA